MGVSDILIRFRTIMTSPWSGSEMIVDQITTKRDNNSTNPGKIQQGRHFLVLIRFLVLGFLSHYFGYVSWPSSQLSTQTHLTKFTHGPTPSHCGVIWSRASRHIC